MKSVYLFLLGLVFSFSAAQKVGYVDTEYIIRFLPEYTTINKQLQTQTDSWRLLIKQKQEAFDKLYAAYELEKVLLTPKQLEVKTKKIEKQRKELNDLKQEKFGVQGEMLKLRHKMAQPLQDKIWNAIHKIAKKRKLAIVFDKNAKGVAMVYTNPRYDVSDFVIEEIIGMNPSKKEKKGRSTNKRRRN